MALVASYGSSSDEDMSDDESISPSKASAPKLPAKSTISKINDSNDVDDPFTDEEGDLEGSQGIAASLPQPIAKATPTGFVDEEEDVSDIPKVKTYGAKEDKTLPPIRGSGKKKVQIKLPTMKSLFKDLEGDDSSEPSVKPSMKPLLGASNSITSFLPPPKHTLPTAFSFARSDNKPSKPSVIPFVPRSLTKNPSTSNCISISASKKRRKEADDNSSDDEEEGFFSFHDKSKAGFPLPLPSAPLLPTLNPSMEVTAEAGPPLLGPSKPDLPSCSYPATDLMTDEAALERLAGRHSLRKKEHLSNVIEINGEDNRADPNVWLTKAVTEDELSKPGPRVTIKGVQKSRHQITYLAQLAKANEFKLQQEWANNAHTRKQSAQKYGF